MRPIYDNTVIHIEVVVGACHLSCANCTRMIGHHRKPMFMDLDMIRKAIASLEGFPGRIGMMGGEPALHPKFREILALFREKIPDKGRREFWTSGFKWEVYESDILETFYKKRISYNDHTQTTGRHHPLLVAIEEVVEDPELRRIMIENCPFQARWSASITPKGAFFCEIAAAQDWLFDGPGGYPVEPGWWQKIPAEFQDQVDRYCGKCSGALPLTPHSDNRGGRDGLSVDLVSPGNLERLKAAGSPRVAKGGYKVINQAAYSQIAVDVAHWKPREFRDFEAHTPEDVKEALSNA
ncbi:MAG TPA: radical SAM protein [Aurantimonas coralicida]|uniref:Radical SAM protein n=2 Tax=root TaxID=1 RepID=A0A9C9NEH8_9HYPH|nr:radical SAM protein [Aurantimonas coralicida]HET99678.1 radical SAM protein [Aurantimonas coralicida]